MTRLLCFVMVVCVFVPMPVRGDDKPIPQNRELMVKNRKAVRVHFRTMYLEGYEKHGHRSAAWDNMARQAIEAFIIHRTSGYRSEAFRIAERTIAQWADGAYARGCRDPLIAVLKHNHKEHYKTLTAEEFAERNKAFAEDCGPLIDVAMQSQYAPVVRIEIVTFAARAVLLRGPRERPLREKTVEYLVECAKLLPEVVADGSIVSLDAGARVLEFMFLTNKSVQKSQKAFHDRIMKELRKANAPEAFCGYAEGNFLIEQAWEARGDGLGPAVAQAAMETFHERLRAAEVELVKAHRAEPNWSLPAACMIDVCRGLGHERDEMEKWFERAMTVDGDSNQACQAKRWYLMPQWHGNAEAVLAFARQCRDTGNWHAGLPQQLVETHLTLPAGRLLNPYFAKPEVWADIASVYEPMLKEHPKAYAAKTRYYYCAVIAGQYTLANELLRQLRSDHFWRGAFKDKAQREAFQRATLRKMADNPPPIDPSE